jgi:hypothetical protein
MMLEISIMFHNIFLDSPRGLDFFTGVLLDTQALSVYEEG